MAVLLKAGKGTGGDGLPFRFSFFRVLVVVVVVLVVVTVLAVVVSSWSAAGNAAEELKSTRRARSVSSLRTGSH